MHAANEIRLIVTLKNAMMLRAMEREGFDTALALAKAAETSPSTVGAYLALKLAPMRGNGDWLPSIQRIAAVLRSLPEDLFPPQFLRSALRTNRAERDISADTALALAGGAPVQSIAYDPESLMARDQAMAALDGALAELKPRQRRVLEMRFGLGGAEPMTLDATAKALGVTRERIRQVELKAMRNMRGGERGKATRALCAPLMEGSR